MDKLVEKKIYTVPKLEEKVRLDKYLSTIEELDISRSLIQSLIGIHHILVDDRFVSKNYRLTGGEKITIHIPPPESSKLEPENIPLDMVYEDEFLAVINKPAGLVVHPAPGNYSHTLVNALLYHFDQLSDSGEPERPGIIHRLDKNTSGLILIAKTDSIARKLRAQFAERKVTKIYHAITCGNMPEQEGTIELPIGRSIRDRKKMTITHRKSRDAVTHYKILQRYKLNDLMEVRLETGRTHQIRVHFAHFNRPVLGDSEYGGRQKWLKGIEPSWRKIGIELLGMISRQALHAKSLEFEHPESGQTINISAELPDDMAEVIAYLDEYYRV